VPRPLRHARASGIQSDQRPRRVEFASLGSAADSRDLNNCAITTRGLRASGRAKLGLKSTRGRFDRRSASDPVSNRKISTLPRSRVASRPPGKRRQLSFLGATARIVPGSILSFSAIVLDSRPPRALWRPSGNEWAHEPGRETSGPAPKPTFAATLENLSFQCLPAVRRCERDVTQSHLLAGSASLLSVITPIRPVVSCQR
jgi:hypothetical protein